jgi:thiosulfate/3-mercaptopyruvate sulfurtransferase
MPTEAYARPELLAEPEWLAEHIDDPDVRVIDCATVEAYRRAHISGAVGLPVHIYVKDPSDETFVMPPDQFAALMGRLGVGDDTTVVTYDDNNGLVATRLWWVLNYYGHTKAKVLNGGWHRWQNEGRPVTTHATHPQPASFSVRANEELICRLPDLKAAIDNPKIQILDVRTDEEWLGTNDRGNKRRGHVPGAIHLEWLNFVSKDDRRVFLPADELRSMLTKAGIRPDAEVHTY